MPNHDLPRLSDHQPPATMRSRKWPMSPGRQILWSAVMSVTLVPVAVLGIAQLIKATDAKSHRVGASSPQTNSTRWWEHSFREVSGKDTPRLALRQTQQGVAGDLILPHDDGFNIRLSVHATAVTDDYLQFLTLQSGMSNENRFIIVPDKHQPRQVQLYRLKPSTKTPKFDFGTSLQPTNWDQYHVHMATLVAIENNEAQENER